MDSGRRTPSLHLISTSHPARPLSTSPSTPYYQSQSPFRYVHFEDHLDEQKLEEIDEKSTPLSELPSPKSAPASSSNNLLRQQSLSRSFGAHPSRAVSPSYPSRILSQPSPLLIHPTSPVHLRSYSPLRRDRLINLIRPWIPVIMYGLTSLGFVVAIAFFKTELFTFLDELSSWLQTEAEYGYALLFILIFITTFPPMPLYSTLIILSGYTFGPWIGATISYLAALTGALTVFIISRTLLRRHITCWLNEAASMKRVVSAIEKRPKLLFLIRLAPYPYNVMNCLLAAAPSLTLRTYTTCTALSLFKVIIHTSLGASIHSFKDYHVSGGNTNSTSISSPDSGPSTDEEQEAGAGSVARIWTIAGIVMCISIFFYISYVARKAVHDEIEGQQDPSSDDNEETVAFLSPRGIGDLEMGANLEPEVPARQRGMIESPFRTQPPLSVNVSEH